MRKDKFPGILTQTLKVGGEEHGAGERRGEERRGEERRGEERRKKQPGEKSRKPTGKPRRSDREIKETENQIKMQRQRQSFEKRLTAPEGARERQRDGRREEPRQVDRSREKCKWRAAERHPGPCSDSNVTYQLWGRRGGGAVLRAEG
jgi:hypothetical protein